MSQPPDTPLLRPRRRCLQFTVRTLLVAMLLTALSLAWLGTYTRRHRARQQVESYGAAQAKIEPAPAWVSDWLGQERSVYFDDLVELDFGGSKFEVREKIDEAMLQQLPVLTRLRRLNLGSVYQVGDASIREFDNLTALEELRLNGTQVTGAGLAPLAGLTCLRILELEDTLVDDAGMPHLAELTSLEELNLRGTQVSDAGLASLSRLVNLKRLHMSGCPVTAAGLRQLTGMQQLEVLWLSETQVGDDAVAVLLELPNLTVLSLGFTELTDAGLARLGALSELKELFLSGSSVTTTAVEDFRRQRPEVEVEFAGH